MLCGLSKYFADKNHNEIFRNGKNMQMIKKPAMIYYLPKCKHICTSQAFPIRSAYGLKFFGAQYTCVNFRVFSTSATHYRINTMPYISTKIPNIMT